MHNPSGPVHIIQCENSIFTLYFFSVQDSDVERYFIKFELKKCTKYVKQTFICAFSCK